MEERKVKCCSTTTMGPKFGVIKAWLTLNHIQYEEGSFSAGSHFWTEIQYQLTGEQFTDLILYLEVAGVLDNKRDVII